MADASSNQFEIERRQITWSPLTTLNDGITALTWDADPNTVVPGNSDGEDWLYGLPIGHLYKQSDATLWWKTGSPNTWQQVGVGDVTGDEIISSDVTYYVDGTDGDDADDGLSWGNAWKTLSRLCTRDANHIPRILAADVVVNVKNTTYSIGTEYHLLADSFVGAGGSLTIVGELTEVEADLIPTGWDNTTSSATFATYVDASAESWTTDEHRGHFLEFTTGHTSGVYYPITRNTATRLECVNLPVLSGTDRFRIVSMPKLRAAQVSTPGTLLEYTAPHFGAAFVTENCTAPIVFKHLDMWEVDDAYGFIMGSRAYFASDKLNPIAGYSTVQNEVREVNQTPGYCIECNMPPGFTNTDNWQFIRCNFNIDNWNSINVRAGCSDINVLGCIFDGDLADGWGIYVYDDVSLVVSATRFKDQTHGIISAGRCSVRVFYATYFENVTNAIAPMGSLIDMSALQDVGSGVRFKNVTNAVNLVGNTLLVTSDGDFGAITDTVTNEIVLANDPSVITADFADVVAEQRISNAASGSAVIYVDSSDYVPKGKSEYDNTSSGLTATNYQDAIDEIDTTVTGATLNADTSLAGNGYFLDEDNMASDDATKVASQQSIVAYVGSVVASAKAYKGGYNADTNTPDLDVSPSSSIEIGDVYDVTVAGTFFTIDVEIGDMLTAKQDAPTTAAHWVITQANLSAASIKTQYESNSDTNAYTDAEKTKVGHISVTQAVDLDAIETAVGLNTAKVTNATHTGDVTGDGALTIAAGAVDIAMLSASGTPGATTFLRGDNTWSVPAGAGDVSKVGTPVDNQVGVWTGDGTIEGDTDLTFDGSNLSVGGNIVVGGTVDGIDIGTDVAANTLKVTNATHTGDVTGDGALTIAADAVTYAKMQNVVADERILGNVAGAGEPVVELTATQVRAMINVADGATAVTVSDIAYNATSWNANTDAASKNAIRDKIEIMDTAIGLNTAKTTNATHTGDATGSGALTLANAAITGKGTVTADGADYVLLSDTSDSGNLKKALVSDLGGSGDVTKVGTPANNQIGVWTGDGTIEGDADFVWDGTNEALGIGTSNPAASLFISREDANASDIILQNTNNTGEHGSLSFSRGRGTEASPLAVETGDNLGVISWAGVEADGTGNRKGSAYIYGVAEGDWSTNIRPTYLSFRTSSSTVSDLGVERLRITGNGRVSTGNTASPDVDPGGLTLQQGTGDLKILTLKSSDVSHPFTGSEEADTYGSFNKWNGTLGGVQLTGCASTGNEVGVNLSSRVQTPSTTTTTSSRGGVHLMSRKSDGGTGSATMGNTDNVFSVAKGTAAGSTTLIIQGSGDIYQTAGGHKLSSWVNTNVAGAIEWDGSNFRGYDGASWVNLDNTGTGSGDVTKVGTPVNNQVGVWTGDGTIEGDANLYWDGTNEYLGIGTNTPDSSLHMAREDTNYTFLKMINTNDTNVFPIFTMCRGRGTAASPTAIKSGDTLGALNFAGYETAGILKGAAYIYCDAEGDWATNVRPCNMSFRTSSSTVGDYTVERFLITGDGRLSTGAEAAPDCSPGGITLNQGAETGRTVTLKNSGVSHPFTSADDADTFGALSCWNPTVGGLAIVGLTETGGNPAIGLSAQGAAPQTTTTASSWGNVHIYSRKSDGGTGTANLGNTDNMFALSSGGSATRWIMQGSGDIYQIAGGYKLSSWVNADVAGAIEWDGSNFRGYTGSAWVNLDTQGAATSPGGSDAQIQYNNGGAFGGASRLYYNDSTDHVGLGVTDPAWDLEVHNTVDGAHALMGCRAYSNSGYSAAFGLHSSRGTVGTPIATADLGALGNIYFVGQADASTARTAALVTARAEEAWSLTQSGTGFNFWTTALGATAYSHKFTMSGDGDFKLLAGGLLVGEYQAMAAAGAVEWDGSNFRGYTGSAWVNLDAQTSATSPGGSDGQIQYNNGGSFGGDTDMTWDDVNHRLTLGANTILTTGGNTAIDVNPGGIILDQGAGDGNIFTLKSSDISHPFTTIANSDTYFHIRKFTGAEGGAHIRGFAENDSSGLVLDAFTQAPHAVDTNPGVIALNVRESDGGTGLAALADTDVGLTYANNSTVKVTVRGSGDIITVAGVKVGAFGGTAAAGVMEWNGSNFRGYTGSGWVNLDGVSGTAVTAASVVADHSIVRGNGGSRDVQGSTVLITDTGQISTGGETSPDCDPGGLCLQQGTNDLKILTMKSSDVSHPFTGSEEADTYGTFNKWSGTLGGVQLTGCSSTGNEVAVNLNARVQTPSTTTTTSSRGGVHLMARKSDGGTGSATMANTDNVFSVAKGTAAGSTTLIIQGSGDIYQTAGGHKLSSWVNTDVAGATEWDGSNFRGYTGSAWVNFDSDGDVTAAAAMTDNTLIKGDGGSKGVQDTGITVDDSDRVENVKTLGYTSAYDNGTVTGTALSVTLSNGQLQKVKLGNAAIALTIVDTGNIGDGTWRLICEQNTGGSFGITSASVSGGTILTPDGSSLTFSTTAGAKDILMIVKEGTEYTLAFGAKNLSEWT